VFTPGVNEGVIIPPRGQISPLGARGEVKKGPLEPDLPILVKDSETRVKVRFDKSAGKSNEATTKLLPLKHLAYWEPAPVRLQGSISRNSVSAEKFSKTKELPLNFGQFFNRKTAEGSFKTNVRANRKVEAYTKFGAELTVAPSSVGA
jgi:hypothetical protein